MKILQAFIISNFTYCSLVYHLCGARNERKLEKLQERALRAVFGDYLSSYDSLLERAEFCLLHTARCRRVAEHVFRALHSLSPLFPNNYYVIKETKYNFRKKFIVMLPEFYTMRFGRNSLRYQAGKLWNALPSNVTLETELVRFKNAVMNMTWCGFLCRCLWCQSHLFISITVYIYIISHTSHFCLVYISLFLPLSDKSIIACVFRYFKPDVK